MSHGLKQYRRSPERPACATRREAPDVLAREQLDALLERGWYRVGQTMIWCEVVTPDEASLGVIWTRVPIAGYAYKKSLRRVMRRVERDFDVRVVPARVTPEHERVYQLYLTKARGERAPDMAAVRGQRPIELFDTWAVEIRDGDELIAFSWFDRGETSLQSILCAYDPAYSAYGLGIYTLLREIRYGIDHGMDYFYAGYVICGDPAMDYKLRTGHIEVLDRRMGQWRPLEEVDMHQLDPIERARRALAHAQHALGGDVPIRHNPHHSVGAHSPSLARCLGYPMFLVCEEHAEGRLLIAMAWDSVESCYELLRCMSATIRDSRTNEVLIDNLYVVEASLGVYEDVREAAHAVEGLRYRRYD